MQRSNNEWHHLVGMLIEYAGEADADARRAKVDFGFERQERANAEAKVEKLEDELARCHALMEDMARELNAANRTAVE